ncbi:protein arginine N-methyltransferase 7-like [Amphibalanus amphitrite]|uniref:protein arginine N-methyltransferase 7-like n=1 Tax=Amphibalanus amphitrite TaxID=1232801 RepID=UPI001C910535|nr:protein arginine N-methyltransferase 7-like [Amphibalanus amphitrite]XP_043198258.1 protein arginine N-methyltransferase 7-like [Amphibalanus amphitrite]XP_043198259.1 protein arginine N-methyltransferase 7-like [Amphibalanus amphitrite]XP_043198260.1 protein arginine N-methyltransferase 7-like [Amphibalanus amphitrite]
MRVAPLLVSAVRRGMSVFTQRVNPVTGVVDWEMQPETYDYQQEVARSAYADMLHDTERNQKYEQGLKAAVTALRAAGRPVHVLDIGTGTGLLSMMACRLGADSVTACEAFRPMAECAGRILAQNGLSERVHLVPKRSTELTVGPEGDLSRRCNLLVTEVFDTELIGEGGLQTFKHAHQHLLEPGSLVVPSSAVVYAQVVQSAAVRRWSRFSPLGSLHVPDDVSECHGAAAVHDLQLSQLSSSDFTALSQPVPVFGFDWTNRTPIVFDRTSVARVEAVNSGTAHAVFMWWDITMDPAGEVLLSCAPYWAHPDTQGRTGSGPEDIPWRDHWMQAVYYLPREVRLRRRDEFNLVSSHDEYSLWFSVNDSEDVPVPGEVSDPAPICLCGLHVTVSRTRAGAMNDPRRHQLYTAALEQAITPGCSVMVISDACIYAVLAAQLGAGRVYVLESSRITRRALEMYCRDNDADDIVQFVDPESVQTAVTQPVDVLFGEPFFYGSVLPWHDLHFWYRARQLDGLCSEKTRTIPHSAELHCVGVEYRDLWKIRAPLHSVEGFKMDLFDDLIESACQVADSECEPHPLWEYPCRALTEPLSLATFDLAGGAPADLQSTTNMEITAPGSCNGVALWMEWILDPAGQQRLTTGPLQAPRPGQQIVWDRYARQAAHLIREPRPVAPGADRLRCQFSFTAKTGDLQVKFAVESA